MNSLIYVGMDVHTQSYAVCCYNAKTDLVFAEMSLSPESESIVKYLKKVRENFGGDCEFICGYEAGGLGYSLYRKLKERDINCVILAPTTMPQSIKKIKTDRLDAVRIAKSLAFNQYRPVFVPTCEDEGVKDFIRMRNDIKDTVKQRKQQLIAFCSRHGKRFDGKSYWTKKHYDWLRSLQFTNAIAKETFTEYMISLEQLQNKVKLLDDRIEELGKGERYAKKVEELTCLKGVSNHSALAVMVEVGDFHRFGTAERFASYLGLVPKESSSGSKTCRMGITKAGNSHVRKLLIEGAQSHSRGNVGYKSKILLTKQKHLSPELNAYVDKANERCRRKFHRIKARTTKHNLAVTAVAREMACFIWGIMTDNVGALPDTLPDGFETTTGERYIIPDCPS